MKTIVRYTFLIALGVIMTSGSLFAQQQQMPPQPEPLSPDEVTKEDLQMVANVSQAAQSIQMEADQKVKSLLAEEKMDYARFQKIMMAQQNPQMAGQINMSDEEKATLQKVQPKLMQISQESRQKYMNAVKDEGMTIQRFQRVAQSIQANPEVAKRFEEINKQTSESDSEN